MPQNFKEQCSNCGRHPREVKSFCGHCSEMVRKRHLLLKNTCVSFYGGACSCCGESQLAFLVIDHVGGGGNAHRQEVFGTKRAGGVAMYRWLIKNDFPKGFQVLCYNCNAAKEYWFGGCPHAQR